MKPVTHSHISSISLLSLINIAQLAKGLTMIIPLCWVSGFSYSGCHSPALVQFVPPSFIWSPATSYPVSGCPFRDFESPTHVCHSIYMPRPSPFTPFLDFPKSILFLSALSTTCLLSCPCMLCPTLFFPSSFDCQLYFYALF